MRFPVRSMMAGVLALSVAAPAFAHPPRHAPAHGYYEYRYDQRYSPGPGYKPAYTYDRRGHHKKWRKGERFDARYTRHVVVHDYRRYHYHAPPPRHGQYYARTDTGQLLLIAAATGLVLWALSD